MGPEKRIAVIGGGSWATAIVKLLLNNVNQLNWFLRNEEDIKFIRQHRHNPKYLTSVLFDTDKITFYNDISEIIESSDVLILAIPAPFLEQAIEPYKGRFARKFVVSAIKGIIPGHNLTIAEYFNRIYDVPFQLYGHYHRTLSC